MNHGTLTISVAMLLTLSFSGLSWSQSTGQQVMRVIVPSSVSIVAPSTAIITHDETNNTNLFPPQTWEVYCNVPSGVTVSFSNQTLFTNILNPSFRRDISLGLSLGAVDNRTNWRIVEPQDSTNFATRKMTAQVTAVSDGVGKAELLLTVGFVTAEFGEFAAGTYEATVIGTVSAN